MAAARELLRRDGTGWDISGGLASRRFWGFRGGVTGSGPAPERAQPARAATSRAGKGVAAGGTERQYGFGDLIRLSVPSLPAPAIGTVEDVTLRVTTVRTADGEVVITPDGQITQVTNLSRDWARAVVDVPCPLPWMSTGRATCCG